MACSRRPEAGVEEGMYRVPQRQPGDRPRLERERVEDDVVDAALRRQQVLHDHNRFLRILRVNDRNGFASEILATGRSVNVADGAILPRTTDELVEEFASWLAALADAKRPEVVVIAAKAMGVDGGKVRSAVIRHLGTIEQLPRFQIDNVARRAARWNRLEQIRNCLVLPVYLPVDLEDVDNEPVAFLMAVHHVQAIARDDVERESLFGLRRARGDEEARAFVRVPVQRFHDRDVFGPESLEVHDQGAQVEDDVIRGETEVVHRVLILQLVAAAADKRAGGVEFVDIQHRLGDGKRDAEVDQMPR